MSPIPIPETIPFNREALEKLRTLIRDYKLGRFATLRAEIVVLLGRYRQSVGLPRRDYVQVTQMSIDLDTLFRILKIKEKKIEGQSRILFKDISGTVLGIIEDGRLWVKFDYGSTKLGKVEPRDAEKAA